MKFVAPGSWALVLGRARLTYSELYYFLKLSYLLLDIKQTILTYGNDDQEILVKVFCPGSEALVFAKSSLKYMMNMLS